MRYAFGLAALAALGASAALAEIVQPTEVSFDDGAVAVSLSGQPGDPAAGAEIMNKGAGNCIACHQVSALEHLPFHGEVGPPLDGVADRWSEDELRGIVANAKMMFDGTIMPAFYKDSGYNRPLDAFEGKTILSAQQVEDVVAYLMTLKEE